LDENWKGSLNFEKMVILGGFS